MKKTLVSSMKNAKLVKVAPPMFEHSLEMAKMVQQHYVDMGYGCKYDKVQEGLYEITVFVMVDEEG